MQSLGSFESFGGTIQEYTEALRENWKRINFPLSTEVKIIYVDNQQDIKLLQGR